MTLYHASGSRSRALTYYKRKKRAIRACEKHRVARWARFGRRPHFRVTFPKWRGANRLKALNALYLSYADR